MNKFVRKLTVYCLFFGYLLQVAILAPILQEGLEDHHDEILEQTLHHAVSGVKPEVAESSSILFPPEFHPFLMPPFTDYGYIQIAYQGHLLPPLIFGLFGSTCPKTVENFKTLLDAHSNPQMKKKFGGYKGTFFYRIVRDGLIQGGRVISS
jgi:Cyclophilin type peptidyl-prolyl cis-trans isomerase/CLD